jgi:4-oxalocrotonate tautomerase
MAARLSDAIVAFKGSEAFREVVWVLIEELHRDGWHIGEEPFFGPPTLMGAPGRSKAAYEAIDGTPTTRENLAAQAPTRADDPARRRIGIAMSSSRTTRLARSCVFTLAAALAVDSSGRVGPEDERCVARAEELTAMFGTSWWVGRIAGIEVRVDSSWVVIALLITYSLYLRFSVLYKGLSTGAAVGIAILAAVLFFGSVLVHELEIFNCGGYGLMTVGAWCGMPVVGGIPMGAG